MRWAAFVLTFGMLPFASGVPMACASAAQARAAVALGAPFTLATGQSAQVGPERIGIAFDAVVGDSRCPTDVQCVRAGEAVVRVVVAAPGQPAETVQLQTTPNRNQATVAGYTLTLTRVRPEPSTKVPIKAADYRATFIAAKP